MNSFVLNFRRAFARVRTTLVAVMDPAATGNTLRWATHSDSDEKNVRRKLNSAVPWLNWIDWSERVLMAFFAFTIGGFAVAGTYPASYVFRNNVYGAYGPLYLDSESAVCSTHAAYWNGTWTTSCNSVNTANYTMLNSNHPCRRAYAPPTSSLESITVSAQMCSRSI